MNRLSPISRNLSSRLFTYLKGEKKRENSRQEFLLILFRAIFSSLVSKSLSIKLIRKSKRKKMARFSDSPSNSARFFLPRFVPTASLSAVHRDQTQKIVNNRRKSWSGSSLFLSLSSPVQVTLFTRKILEIINGSIVGQSWPAIIYAK